jgi:hypothetical protein
MRKLTGLLSLAIVSGGLMAGVPAKADTVYHRVYRQSMTATDPFSILDTYQNNGLRPEEYRKGNNTYDFDSLDTNKNGFLSRSEFYRTTDTAQNPANLSSITPAAGGTARGGVHSDIVYKDDPCDVTAYRNDGSCR